MSIARSDLAAVIYDALGGAAELILDDTVGALVDEEDRVRVVLQSGQEQRGRPRGRRRRAAFPGAAAGVRA